MNLSEIEQKNMHWIMLGYNLYPLMDTVILSCQLGSYLSDIFSGMCFTDQTT